MQRAMRSLAIFLFLAAGFAGQAHGQCILANPSFEIAGSGDDVFGGWNQFGAVGSVAEATHGAAAARVSGQDDGSWNMSAFWQRLDCVPGEQWDVTGWVKHAAGAPLIGQCIALVNVEWRDAADVLIDYDTFAVADASTPVDEYIAFSAVSTPAPAGTVATHVLIGVLQGQDDPVPEVHYDQVTFFSLMPPTIDDMQWDDFPGGSSVEFADRTWRVKGSGWYGPGPNHFSDLPESVWVDGEDRLHMTIKFRDSIWYSTEVTLVDMLGYGDYIFTTIGSLDQLDIHAVLGLFLWQYGPCWGSEYMWWNPYNEIDVEFSRWANPGAEIGQFVAQPWDWEGNLVRFDATFGAEELASHAFNWLPDRIEFRSWRGGPAEESPENLIFAWTYTGPHIPRPEQPRVHINLWQTSGPPATDQEVIVADFTFVPEGGPAPIEDLVIWATGQIVTLQWTAVDGASQYHIYESSAPYGPWTRIITCYTNSQDLVLTGERKFYQVTWE